MIFGGFMYCQECGAKVGDSDRFCVSCGAVLTLKKVLNLAN